MTMMMRPRVARPAMLALLGVGAALLLAACGGAPAEPSATDGAGTQVGDRAPDFSVTTMDGEVASLPQFVDSGTPVVLYFFASW